MQHDATNIKQLYLGDAASHNINSCMVIVNISIMYLLRSLEPHSSLSLRLTELHGFALT